MQGKKSPSHPKTDETWLTKRKQFCLCYTNSSLMTDNGYQGLREHKQYRLPSMCQTTIQILKGLETEVTTSGNSLYLWKGGQLQEGDRLKTARICG